MPCTPVGMHVFGAGVSQCSCVRVVIGYFSAKFSDPGPHMSGSVGRVAFAGWAATLGGVEEPVVIENAPWPPPDRSAWHPSALAAWAPVLDPVRCSDGPRFYNPSSALEAANNASGEDGFAWEGASGLIHARQMPTAAFFGRHPAPGCSYRYYSGSALDGGGTPLRPLRPLPSPSELGAGAGSEVVAKVWLGTRGSTMPLHFDSQHNLFAQLFGAKTFLLFPPNPRGLPIFPRTHPLSFFARVDCPNNSDDDCARRQRHLWPQFDAATAGARRVTVGAGDLLYVPPFWSHEVPVRVI